LGVRRLSPAPSATKRASADKAQLLRNDRIVGIASLASPIKVATPNNAFIEASYGQPSLEDDLRESDTVGTMGKPVHVGLI
jgi:hypothetical protein